ncbi:TPA: type II toxin-antitoxin system HicB family antitoxin [Staphylococcus aureus]|uniref:type II toxin-antitoxin system HicB family antitoxin n=1 Tax=Staphylococcus aureus TaxID=1280 RepID=UPI0013F5EE24|nr:type II toxin-antitoxin system HicB family antitoxin [Staphylococcus aureus]MDG6600742.1 type II toxin-antitoxin system HicB family antitoxin [Staphylococcus aureus]MDG6616924.1 type II toxin-antitoxin system HicB family antitoxin [Staphylococcus aureus]MDG6622281.1 type II toxin-antitoxin system HicB family antitoxin [Staphylococcus aureus]MDN5191625.1 type II toxin-antitoxin system HicB family antitoxin [Staphylococcus aureus]MDN5194273.1 type II toxin-antitoxin system HicB family antitox
MKYYYYAILEKEGNYYNVSFPDLPGALTFGEGIEEAVEMASDALGGHLIVMEDEGDVIPKPSEFKELSQNLNDDEQLQLIFVNTNVVRAKEENKTVNKMVTLPQYLVELGKEKKINFSQTLQRALKDELNI